MKDIDNSHLWVGFTSLLAGLFCFPALDYFSALDVEWETLLTGLLALVAAAWTITQLRKQNSLQQQQIELQQKQILERDERFARTARAKLPAEITRGLKWLESCMFSIHLGILKRKGENPERKSPENTYPQSLFKDIAETAQFFDKHIGELIVDICRSAQIIESRSQKTNYNSNEYRSISDSKLIAKTYAKLEYLFYEVDKHRYNTEENITFKDMSCPFKLSEIELEQKGLKSMFIEDIEIHDNFTELWR